jgi:hypothetical protein
MIKYDVMRSLIFVHHLATPYYSHLVLEYHLK